MFPALFGSLLAGLAGSPHCIGMCGGLIVASGAKAPSWPHTAGRLVTYGVLGALAGGLSHQAALPWQAALFLSVAMLFWFAASLAELPLPRLHAPAFLSRLGGRLIRRPDLASRFAFGLVNGLLPCGLVYAALSIPVALADPLLGALAMVLFGLGTVPALTFAVAGLRRLAAGSLARRRLLGAAVFLIGLLTLASRGEISWRASSNEAVPTVAEVADGAAQH